ncbi:MAG: 50S ribosome-binding GTPase [Candidatus Thermoplasmatota archaeon]|nr:50S ribosome-binding GTPase [Candidatus Thermoplasmatota archaeon]
MFDIPTVLTAEELLDRAFKKASKVDYHGRTKLESVREINIGKLKSVSDVIVTTLGRYVKAFPSIDRQSPFYSELIDVTIGRDKLKKSLGAMDWCRGNAARVAKEARREIAAATAISRIDQVRKSAYGRISSLVKQVDKELAFLAKARNIMRKFPAVNPDDMTIVVAGAPNVGKSALVARISTAKPRVAVYPFTTQEISVGTFEKKYLRYQVIDTPGLLDRELSKRNPMELRAVLALRHLADVIVFMFDPTETCGYMMSQQGHLLETIRSEFAKVPIVEIENKSDLLKTRSDRLRISAETGAGVQKLVDRIVDLLKPQQRL